MSLPILTPSDFVGVVFIADAKDTTYGASTIQEYIDEFEPIYLRMILGDKHFSEIRDQSPLDQKYIDLIDGNDYTDVDDEFRTSLGLKEVLKNLIYTEYVKENWLNTLSGNTRSINANSKAVTPAANKQIVYSRYNYGTLVYNNDVLPFLENYQDIAEDIVSSVDNGGGSYTINVISTLYLVDGDTVRIDGIDYVITNLVADTSFDISGAVLGLDFAGNEAEYKPFDTVFFNFGQAWI